MGNVESVPVELFVTQVLSMKVALNITDSWPLKQEAIQNAVIKHLNDIGIYTVKPFGQGDIVKKEILFFLKHSSLILDLIDKAKRAAAAAAQRGKSSQDV